MVRSPRREKEPVKDFDKLLLITKCLCNTRALIKKVNSTFLLRAPLGLSSVAFKSTFDFSVSSRSANYITIDLHI